MVVIGNKIHWKTIHKYLNLPNFGGRGGRRMIDRVAVEINPTMARVIINLVMYGRFKDKIVLDVKCRVNAFN